MRRLFWLGVGAAAGYYVAKRTDGAVDRARERGVAGNVELVTTTATRAAQTATRAASVFVEQARAATAEPSPSPRPAPAPSTRTSREVRP